MSASVWCQRLAELGEAGLLGRTADQRYQLTGIGRGLAAALDPLNEWARRWAQARQPSPLACALIYRNSLNRSKVSNLILQLHLL